MAKTDLTKKVEKALWEATHEKVHGCFEVKIGLPKTQAMLTGNEEFVDVMKFRLALRRCCWRALLEVWQGKLTDITRQL